MTEHWDDDQQYDDDIWEEENEEEYDEEEEFFDDDESSGPHSPEAFDPILDLPPLKEVPLKGVSLTPSFGERHKLKKTLPILFDIVNLDVSGENNGTKKVR
jgi:hypothetical protein